MTWQEMIEAAHLDALGLLDEQERERFDAAFTKLPADLKAQLRAEQDRAVRFEIADELDEVQPPESLRALVLAAVRTASAQSQTVEHKGGRQTRPMKRASVVSPMWRAGSLGLVAACLVMGGVIVNLLSQVQSLDEQARGIAASDTWRQYFARMGHDIAFDKNTDHKIFTVASASFPGEATVFSNPAWDGKVWFQCSNFPMNGTVSNKFKVVILDGQGKPEKSLATITPNGGRVFSDFAVDASQIARLAIVMVEASGAETVVMTIKA